MFDETAAIALGFSANSYVAMTPDEERYASLSLLRASVKVTIKTRINGTYVNNKVSEMEVLDGPFSLWENKENDVSTTSVVPDVSTSSCVDPDDEMMTADDDIRQATTVTPVSSSSSTGYSSRFCG